MSDENKDHRAKAQVLEENERLRRRLEEAEQTLEAIRHGDVDALVVAGPRGEQIFSISGAEHIYRVIIETMNEAALTVDPDGTILFCNQRFCDLMKAPIQEVIGRKVTAFVARPQGPPLRALLADAQGKSVQQHLTLRATDGTAVPVQLSASPLRVDEIISICLVASDLTELEASANSIRVLREHQQAMQEANEQLRARTDELAAVNATLQTSEAMTREQATRLEAVLDAAPAIIWIAHDRDCRSITGNRAARAFSRVANNTVDLSKTGPAPETLAHYRVFADGVELEPQDMPIQVAVRSGREFRDHSVEFRFDNGTSQWLVGNIVPLLDEQGHPNGAIAAFLDVTERKQMEEALRESEEWFRTLADNMSQLAWMADGTGRRSWYNKRWYEYTGRTFEEMQGWGWQKVHHPDCVEQVVPEYLRHMEVGEAWEDTFALRGRDGRYRWFLTRAIPIRDARGNVVKWFGTNTDVTELRRAEEALRELTKTLESKVAQRTTELERRAGQLQKLALELSEAEDRERKRLAEILHDDLQQILAASKFHLSLLRNRVKSDPSLQATVAQIDLMLTDAIEKSRSLSHELSPTVLHHGDFAETLEWLAGQVQVEHGLLVHVDALSKVILQSDAIKAFLYKAARELLFNVVKHARVREARIRVRRGGRCVCLSVSDRGRGFDPQRLPVTAGFGLFGIRERVELLGGRVKIKSGTDKGTTFRIVVPDGEPSVQRVLIKQEPNSRAREDRRAQDGGERGLRVLLADDHEIVREGLISLLSDEHGIQVVGEAANGREAVNQADRLRPDVVIMDVAMPLIDGDEATRQIKQHLPNTRVVALSMYDDAEARERMFTAGAEAYLLKTAPSEELLAAVRGKTPAT